MAMSQISPPLRIALIAAVAFLAVWMVALRPSGEEPAAETSPAPAGNVATGAPAQSAPGTAVHVTVTALPPVIAIVVAADAVERPVIPLPRTLRATTV